MRGKKKGGLLWIILISFFGIILIKQQVTLNRLNKQYKLYAEQLAKQKSINSQLKEQKKLTKRDDYIVNTARSELNLIKPGELLFIDKNRQK